MGLSSSISMPGVHWSSGPPIERDMNDALSFAGPQDPGVKLSEGSGAFELSSSRSAQLNSFEGQPSCGVTGDGLTRGSWAVSVFES